MTTGQHLRPGAAVSWTSRDGTTDRGTVWSKGPTSGLWWVVPTGTPRQPQLVRDTGAELSVHADVDADWAGRVTRAANEIAAHPRRFVLCAIDRRIHRVTCGDVRRAAAPLPMATLVRAVTDPDTPGGICPCVWTVP